MKQIYFFFLLHISFFSINAQTKAYPFGITKGLTETCIDLRRSDYQVIAHQQAVTVNYYESFNNAIDQSNPLDRFFIPTRFPQTIYARVTSNLNSSFAISEEKPPRICCIAI